MVNEGMATKGEFAWAYHKGGCNIVPNMLFHTSLNLAYSIVTIAPTVDQRGYDKYWHLMIFTLVSALLLWTLSPPKPTFRPNREAMDAL